MTFLGAPMWVWGVFVYLIAIGIANIHTLRISFPKLFILPLVFWGMRYHMLVSGTWGDVGSYILGVVIGGVLGYNLYKDNNIKVLKHLKSLEIPGNYITFILLMMIFGIRFFFGYYKATHLIVSQELLMAEYIISGIFAGIFSGRTLYYLRLYYKAT